MRATVRFTTGKMPEAKIGNKAPWTLKANSSQFTNSPAERILFLQRTIGNQAVQRLIKSRALLTKLRIGQPGDVYEQEADRVAERVMWMPEPVAKKLEVSSQMRSTCIQRRCPRCIGSQTGKKEEEKFIYAKEVAGSIPEVAPELETSISGIHGGGQPLPGEVRAFFEPRFGYDFSQVRVHTDAKAAESARAVNALAYTVGCNVVFGAGQYMPDTREGKRLLAHELIHITQQTGTNATVQRQHVPDTGFRYTPPASVTRSIVEIQGIVGTTPDGVYGENTRIAVEKYQTKLKALGFYSDTIDGKWGSNTEAAHVAFAIAPNIERRGYNCAGFAFKDYQFHGMAATKAKYSSMTKLSDCSKNCNPFYHKFWYWEVDVSVTNTTTGATTPTWRDFHTVGGQTDKKGKGPDQVMSKNGQRPVEGPKPPLNWGPTTGPVIDNDGNPIPNARWNISNVNQECFCNDKLP